MLDKIDAPTLAAYVVWVPRNGARQAHMDRVTGLVADARATQYWDAESAVIDPYTEMLQLTGPCAGIFMIYGPQVRWEGTAPPEPDYAEDAHAKQYKRPWPQFDAERFAEAVRAALPR